MSDGPLSKLLRGLGLDDKLPVIAAIKRIDERPVSLNPECLFKMAPAPDLMSDTGIHRLWDGGPELPTSIPKSDLRAYDLDVDYASFRPEGERWRVIDLSTFTGDDEGVGSFVGYGASEKEARTNLLRMFAEYDADELDRKEAEKARKPFRPIHSSPFEPTEYADPPKRDDFEDVITFDDGLDSPVDDYDGERE